MLGQNTATDMASIESDLSGFRRHDEYDKHREHELNGGSDD